MAILSQLENRIRKELQDLVNIFIHKHLGSLYYKILETNLMLNKKIKMFQQGNWHFLGNFHNSD